MKTCSVCGNEFFESPLIRYENMPKAAQFLPELPDDKGINLEVVQCSACGLVQLTNDPVPYYKDVIRASAVSKEMIEFRESQFHNFIERFFLKDKNVIEIGCGCGEYLRIMQEFNHNVQGLEHSSKSVIQCLKDGLLVGKGFIDSTTYELKGAPYDAFYALNFLEHMPGPNIMLQGIHNNLSEDAVGIVEVPNFNMILRNQLFSEFTSDHLLYFTMGTLSRTLEINGFEVISIDEVFHDYIISAIVRKRKRLDLSYFESQKERIKKEVHAFIKMHDKVAIWGAGHQSLAMICLMELAGKIEHVIDSAPFKQNKYTPASHIPIVSPLSLIHDPVSAVIIIAGGYSDEIAKTIREKYSQTINIAILRDFGLEKIA